MKSMINKMEVKVGDEIGIGSSAYKIIAVTDVYCL